MVRAIAVAQGLMVGELNGVLTGPRGSSFRWSDPGQIIFHSLWAFQVAEGLKEAIGFLQRFSECGIVGSSEIKESVLRVWKRHETGPTPVV